MVIHKSKLKGKRKEKNKIEQQQTHHLTTVIHLHQLGLTTVVDTPKLRDGELDQLLGAFNKEAATRNQKRRKKIEKIQA